MCRRFSGTTEKFFSICTHSTMFERVFTCIFVAVHGSYLAFFIFIFFYSTVYLPILLCAIDMHCVIAAFIPTIRNMRQYPHGPNDNVQFVAITHVARLFLLSTITPMKYDTPPNPFANNFSILLVTKFLVLTMN
jgi:hypothetical protein